MKSLRHLLTVTAFLVPFLTAISQTPILEIHQWDNTTVKVELQRLQKITFAGTDMKLNLKSGDVNTYATSSIRNLIFGTLTGNREINYSTDLLVFPNPATEFIQLKNFGEASAQAFIYSLNGQLMQQQLVTAQEQTISIADLQPGIYLVKVANHILRFSKL